MRLSRNQKKFGTLQRDLPFLKDVIDYRLTRHPRIYLFVERFRTWVNWDKRVYLSFVRKGDFVLDVGANVGAHAIFLSHLVGEEGSVLAFEPLPSNVDALHETIERRSRIANIHIIQTAVGNPDGSTAGKFSAHARHESGGGPNRGGNVRRANGFGLASFWKPGLLVL